MKKKRNRMGLLVIVLFGITVISCHFGLVAGYSTIVVRNLYASPITEIWGIPGNERRDLNIITGNSQTFTHHMAGGISIGSRITLITPATGHVRTDGDVWFRPNTRTTITLEASGSITISGPR